MLMAGNGFSAEQAMPLFAPDLGRLFGGASMQVHHGVWTVDGAEFKDRYADGQLETGLKLTVSVMTEQLESALLDLKTMITRFNQTYDWQLQWIHTEVETVEQRHFQLSD